MNGMDSRAFFDDWREGLNKEEKEMTKAMEREVGRIYEELAKWCAERNVAYEYNFSTDEGESCTFITPDTTLTVNHVEARDPEQFSRYVKSVLFGVDDIIIDHLKAQVDDLKKENDKKDERIVYLETRFLIENRESLYGQISQLEEEIESKDACISRLEKEDKEKAKDIEYLEKELKKVRDENTALRYQLDMKRTKISELEDEVKEKGNNLNDAADKIVQMSVANTSLKGHIDGLRLQLKAERKSYEDLEEDYDKKCADCINLANSVDSEVAKRMKAQEMLKTYEFEFYLREKAEAKIEELKKENATLQYKVDALENNKKDLLSAYKKDLDNINNEIKKLKQQIM